MQSLRSGHVLAIACAAFCVVLTICAGIAVVLISRSIPGPDSNFWHDPGESSAIVLDRRGTCLTCEHAANARVKISSLPPHVIQAFLAAEDRRFFRHWGIDPWGIARALWANLRAGRVVEGGSTITQQVVKSYMLDKRRRLGRKLFEAAYAIALEQRLSKSEIFELYLRRVFFGQGAHGLAEAAHIYFRKAPTKLSVSEAAMLAALPKAPSYFDPVRYPERTRQRQRLVLHRMHSLGFLTAAQLRSAIERRVAIRGRVGLVSSEDIVLREHILRELRSSIEAPSVSLFEHSVHSTVDLELQAIARQSMERLRRQLKLSPSDLAEVEAATIVADVQSGEILATVGGLSAHGSQFDRVTSMHRQLGSAFLPLLYAMAFDRGAQWNTSLYATEWAAAAPHHPVDGRATEPTLFDGLRGHLAFESTRLAGNMGLGTLNRYCRSLGLNCDYGDIRLAAGMSEETLLGFAQAFACLARGGACVKLRSVARVVDQAGQTMHQADSAASTRVMSEHAAFLVNAGLSRSFRGSGLAAYVGRDERGHNLWAVAYDDRFLVATWLGAERGRVSILSRHPAIADNLYEQITGLWETTAHSPPTNEWLRPPPMIAVQSLATLEGATKLPVSLRKSAPVVR